MSIGAMSPIVFLLIPPGLLPVWPHARSWGYRPTEIVGVIVVVLIVLLLMGRRRSGDQLPLSYLNETLMRDR